MPNRIQRRRTKGWRMPPGCVSVTRPGKHGNPFKVGHYHFIGDPKKTAMSRCTSWDKPMDGFTLIETVEQSIDWYRKYATLWALKKLEELRDHDLCCFCKLCEEHKDGKPHSVTCPECAPCHVDVIFELLYGDQP